jgi:hypothetical protein
MIGIDIHPVGENLTDKPHASHARSTYGLWPYVSHTVNILQHFAYSSTELSRATAPKKRVSWPNPQHDSWPIYRSAPSFSPKTTIEVVEAKPILCWQPATRLTEPITPACDQYVGLVRSGSSKVVAEKVHWTCPVYLKNFPKFKYFFPTLILELWGTKFNET